jgi:hypothetical protein
LFIGSVGCTWSDPELALHKLSSSFIEKEATWICSENDDYGACVSWRMIGLPPTVTVDYDKEPTGIINLTPGQLGWIEFDVMQDLLEFMTGPYELSMSYLVKKVCEHGPGCATFWSCEGGRCPELDVMLRTNCPATPITPEVGTTTSHAIILLILL